MWQNLFSKFWQKKISQKKKEKKRKRICNRIFHFNFRILCQKKEKKVDYLLLLGYYQLPKSRNAAGPLP
jgi:hypothetical protein